MIFSPATPIQAEFPQHAVSPSTAVQPISAERMGASDKDYVARFIGDDCAACEGDPCFFSCMGERASERLGADA